MTNKTEEIKKLEILIVEDREENRNAALEAFSQIGDVQVDFATNYEEAMRKMPLKPYAAAIIDLEFPLKTGSNPERLGDKLIDEATKEGLPAVILTGGYFHGGRNLARIFYDSFDVKYGYGETTSDKVESRSWIDAYNVFDRNNLEMVARARERRIRFRKMNKGAEK